MWARWWRRWRRSCELAISCQENLVVGHRPSVVGHRGKQSCNHKGHEGTQRTGSPAPLGMTGSAISCQEHLDGLSAIGNAAVSCQPSAVRKTWTGCRLSAIGDRLSGKTKLQPQRTRRNTKDNGRHRGPSTRARSALAQDDRTSRQLSDISRQENLDGLSAIGHRLSGNACSRCTDSLRNSGF